MQLARNHILVIDDQADAADTFVELLSIWGYDAIACYSGATALESACSHRPDVVLLDLGMPSMDGFQFASMFRELSECGSIPIIVVSGHSSQTYLSRASEAGINEYLVKPADPKCLKDILARTIVATLVPSSISDDTANRLAVMTLGSKRRIHHGLSSQEYSAPMRRKLACI